MDLRSGWRALGSSVEQLEVPPSDRMGWGWGWGGERHTGTTSEVFQGLLPAAMTCLVFPLSPPGGLAVENYPGRVPGPAWEEGLPAAGGRPGVLQAPHLPHHGIHLPRGGPALPGHL